MTRYLLYGVEAENVAQVARPIELLRETAT